MTNPFAPAPNPGSPPAQPAFAPPQQPPQQPALPAGAIGAMFAGMGDANTSGDRHPPLPQGGHERLRVSNLRVTQSGKNTSIWYFQADLTVLESSTTKPGSQAIFMEKITGHQYQSHKDDSFARIRSLISACMGKDPNAQDVRAEFNAQYQSIIDRAIKGEFEGREVAVANVTHVVTKAKLDARGQMQEPQTIAKIWFAPLGSAVAAAPAQPPAPAQAPAKPWPPAGWQPHPDQVQYAGYYYGQVNGTTYTIPEAQLRAAQDAGQV